jgi:predicted nucleic acid-binding protein
MTAPIFVDTNVLIYSLDSGNAAKQTAARQWRQFLWKSGRGRISFQVLQEFYVNALRIRPAAATETRAEIRDLLDWEPVVMSVATLELAWQLQDRYQLSFWDALIVAAAKAAGCAFVLTEDLQTGQDLDGVKVLNPFLTEPASFGGW